MCEGQQDDLNSLFDLTHKLLHPHKLVVKFAMIVSQIGTFFDMFDNLGHRSVFQGILSQSLFLLLHYLLGTTTFHGLNYGVVKLHLVVNLGHFC